MNQHAWTAGLRAAVEIWRADRQMPELADAPARTVALAQVLGAGFAAFVMDEAPALIAERDAEPAQLMAAVVDTPTLVWVTDDIGMIAAASILAPDAEHLLAAPQEVFDRWMAQHPDWPCRLHLEHVGLFAAPDEDDRRRCSAKQRDAPGELLMYRVASVWGDDASHEARHLWRWHAGELTLVAERLGGAILC